jgi:uncharacterized protein (TIGR03435 family)
MRLSKSVTTLMLAVVWLVADASGQSVLPTSAPRFDVVSVKRNESGSVFMSTSTPPGGRYEARNVRVVDLLTASYGVRAFQVIGLPEWTNEQRFDINATGDASASVATRFLMLQSLLRDRFALVVRTETQMRPIYALRLANSDGRLGPNLVRSPFDCVQILAARNAAPAATTPPGPTPPPGPDCTFRIGGGGGNRGLLGQGRTVRELATMLSSPATGLNRVVLDETNLTGTFDFDLRWTPEQFEPSVLGPSAKGNTAPTPEQTLSVFTAIREQLGLKLEPSSGPMQVLIVDQILEPTPN